MRVQRFIGIYEPNFFEVSDLTKNIFPIANSPSSYSMETLSSKEAQLLRELFNRLYFYFTFATTQALPADQLAGCDNWLYRTSSHAETINEICVSN